MSEGTIETMLRRIEHLERANRAMKFIALGAVLACIALNAVPALSSVFPHGPKQIDAERFNLITPKGALIATLSQGTNGGYLAFFDANGKPEMQVGTSAGPANQFVGAAIFDGNALLAGTGVARQVWSMSTQNSVTTVGNFIFDGNEKVRLSNSTAGDGTNAFSLFYDATQQRAGIGFGANGPGAFFQDSTGAARILEAIKADDSATVLTMLNSSGDALHPLADLSALGDGSNTVLQIEDHNNHPRLTEGFSLASGEIILLHDVNQAETFRAPCTGAACP
jgi:hypothetical protein